jgi:hypothetical protein
MHSCDLRKPTTTHLAACTESCTRRLHACGRAAAALELLHCSELVAMPLLLLFTAAAALQCTSSPATVSLLCPTDDLSKRWDVSMSELVLALHK